MDRCPGTGRWTPNDSFHVARFPVVFSKISVIPHIVRDDSIDVLRVVIGTAISYYIGNSLSSRSIPLDPVRSLRLLLADQPQPHVALDLGTVALGGVAAVDELVDKLDRQVVKHKDRITDHHHSAPKRMM